MDNLYLFSEQGMFFLSQFLYYTEGNKEEKKRSEAEFHK